MNGENANHTSERKYENLGEMTELLRERTGSALPGIFVTGQERISLKAMGRDKTGYTVESCLGLSRF